ncbi:hypothetical protein D1872_260800 [compost metagenome]
MRCMFLKPGLINPRRSIPHRRCFRAWRVAIAEGRAIRSVFAHLHDDAPRRIHEQDLSVQYERQIGKTPNDVLPA